MDSLNIFRSFKFLIQYSWRFHFPRNIWAFSSVNEFVSKLSLWYFWPTLINKWEKKHEHEIKKNNNTKSRFDRWKRKLTCDKQQITLSMTTLFFRFGGHYNFVSHIYLLIFFLPSPSFTLYQVPCVIAIAQLFWVHDFSLSAHRPNYWLNENKMLNQ